MRLSIMSFNLEMKFALFKQLRRRKRMYEIRLLFIPSSKSTYILFTSIFENRFTKSNI